MVGVALAPDLITRNLVTGNQTPLGNSPGGVRRYEGVTNIRAFLLALVPWLYLMFAGLMLIAAISSVFAGNWIGAAIDLGFAGWWGSDFLEAKAGR